ncbi:MAG: tetratricopeptide repeat protein [Chromatiales bacterium]|nr:tetratricopeptide repeat protein [Chromatiales bacterium]
MRAIALIIVAVSIALGLVYQQVTGFGFLEWDDAHHIRDNNYLRSLTPENLRWILLNADIDYWRPISFLSHGLDFALFGDNTAGHHVVSVILHGVNALLVGAITWVTIGLTGTSATRTQAWLIAALAALVFAVHPQHVESTAWLAERKGLLCTGFYLAAVLTYLKGHGTHRTWLKASLGCFLLAMFSKPMAVSVPLVLVALDVYPLRRLTFSMSLWSAARIVLAKWPYLVLAALLGLYTYVAVQGAGYLTDADRLDQVERAINASRSIWLYPWRWLYPIGLSPLYPLDAIDNSPHMLNLLPGAALIFLSGGALWLFRAGHAALLGICMVHLAMVGPVLGIVHTGFQSSADRYGYLPGALLSVVAAILLLRLFARLVQPRLRIGICVLLLVWVLGLGASAERQVGVWRTDYSMWHTVFGYFPKWVPNKLLSTGQDHYARGRYEESLEWLQKAIDQRQRSFDAHLYLGLALQELGRAEEAKYHIARGLELVPDSIYHLQLAIVGHIQGGRYELARDLIARVQTLAPELRESLRQLALVNFETGNIQTARRILTGMVTDRPTDIHSWLLLGIIAQLNQEYPQARAYYERVLKLRPDNRDAIHNLTEIDRAQAEANAADGKAG